MPEIPQPKPRPHPSKRDADVVGTTRVIRRAAGRSLPYAELHVTTNFTFLTGASHPEELVERAAVLGHHAVAIADCNSLAGVVRGHVAAKQAGMPFVVGCRLELGTGVIRADAGVPDGPSLSVLVYPTCRASYARLCRLLTRGKRRAEKGSCHLVLHDLLEMQECLLAVVVPPAVLDQHLLETLRGLRPVFDDDRLSLAASHLYGSDDAGRLDRLATLSDITGVPLVATNDVHYHVPERHALQDVLTCIRHGCTVSTAGFRLQPHAERCLKPPETMSRLFRDHPDAVARTVVIAERAAAFSLDELRYEYPQEVCPPPRTPMEHLRALTEEGARTRYPGGVPTKVRDQIAHELALIDELEYATYFLTVYDLVRFARGRGILCQGRGAAANSAVCYCLGVTSVDPDRTDLLFERFISKERDEPPDIDIDFEHERREEVIQYIYGKYGRERAALTAEVITYRGRSAVREVGKALGLSLDIVDRLARNIDWWHDGVGDPAQVREIGLDPADPTLARVLRLSREIIGFPRHLSQHVGGFVITRAPLCELVPIENAAMSDRTVIEWDKDDIDAMGMLKVDVLGLGMLTCIRKALDLVKGSGVFARAAEKGSGVFSLDASDEAEVLDGEKTPDPFSFTLATVPAEDPAVYDAICAADTIGVFQIESRAQMSMLPRLRPRCFYDLVIEVAIVRPGPIQGDMVHPYLRRRNGEEPVTYPGEAVRKVLEKTLGVPLFQEQAMSLAIVAAGFTPGEADQLRRAMAAWKRKGNQIERFGERLVAGMLERGYERDFAERCFSQIKGFSEYGFPESHAASFALLVYVSAWLKVHHPAAFAAALLNSQPMGFYAPAQIVRDAQEHGVEVRVADVNFSAWDCELEAGTKAGDGRRNRSESRIGELSSSSSSSSSRRAISPSLRLGLRLIKGMRREDGDAIADAVRSRGPFDSVEALRRASGVRVSVLRRLAGADAFISMGLDRQQALWAVRALHDDKVEKGEKGEKGGGMLPIFAHLDPPADASIPPPRLPAVSGPRQVAYDYASMHLSLKAHPVSFLRAELRARTVTETSCLKDEHAWPNGSPVAVAGLVLVRQRPATAAGIVFMTLEDETGIANLIVRPPIYKRYRRIARHGVAIVARGTVERQGEVVHVMVRSFEGLDDRMQELAARSRDFR